MNANCQHHTAVECVSAEYRSEAAAVLAKRCLEAIM